MKLQVIGSLDHSFSLLHGKLVDNPLAGPDPRRPVDLRGSAAAISETAPGRYRLVRDSLGINKIFWAESSDQSILAASRPDRLIKSGCPLSSIYSLGPGQLVDIDLGRRVSQQEGLLPRLFGDADAPPGDLGATAANIAGALAAYCDVLAAAYSDRRIFVCASGGLDSTGVAVEVKEHFKNLTAVSFDLKRPSGAISEDRLTARRLAADWHVPLLEVTVTEQELLEPLDTVLTEGIDWRDFNVHAALVNAALARAIAAELASTGEPGLVFTGDLMNEFLVDYHEERYGGQVYYRLPRLGPKSLQRVLVRGAETSHREIGIFEAWNVPVVQLYSIAAHLYCSLPADFLAAEGNKERLTRLVFDNRIPEYVYKRRKTRAQIGDPEVGKGVLALCIDRGIDQEYLRGRFAALHRVDRIADLDDFISAGRYRAAVPFSGGET